MASDSDPPPSGDAELEERDLSLPGAAAWMFAAIFFVLIALELSHALRPGLDADLVNNQICFSLGFAVCIFGIVRLHLPARALADTLGARPAFAPLYLVALALGVALQGPATGLGDLVSRYFPLSEEARASYAAMTHFDSLFHKIVFASITTAIGPFFEEMLCRGVLFRALRRSHSGAVTVVATALAFALVHIDPRAMLNAFLCGLVLGAIRETTGSVIPALLAHAGYNAVITFALLHGTIELSDEQSPMPLSVVFGSAGAVLVLLFALRTLAARSELATLARREDTQ